MSTNKKRVICFGEVLWDLLPSGKKPGGAPMNVAAHLTRQGIPAGMISSIGDDALGSELKAYLTTIHVSTDLLQLNTHYPTGRVNVDVSNPADVKYDIEFPAAWDYIELNPAAIEAVTTAEVFVFGSLAARSEVSRASLHRLLEVAGTKVFDINLRAPHYDRYTLEALLHKSDIVKLNEDELPAIAQWYTSSPDQDQQIIKVQEAFGLEAIIVTLGGDGAKLYHKGEVYTQPGFPVKVADTIGSGDSFLASFLRQYLECAPASEQLKFACAVGAMVATHHGANPEYTDADIAAFLQQQK